MSKTILTVLLTDTQQRRIKEATGESISELNIDFASQGGLTEEELAKLSGGSDTSPGLKKLT